MLEPFVTSVTVVAYCNPGRIIGHPYPSVPVHINIIDVVPVHTVIIAVVGGYIRPGGERINVNLVYSPASRGYQQLPLSKGGDSFDCHVL